MRLLVTGAGGFVGRHLVECAAEQSVECIAVARHDGPPNCAKADLLDRRTVAKLLAGVQPDVVVHAASSPAWRHGDAVTAAAEEQTMAGNLLKATAELPTTPLLVMLGSAAEYGDLGSTPIAEDARPQPTSPYGKARARLAEDVTHAAGEVGAPLTWARVFNLLGPDQPSSAPVANWAHQIASAEDGAEVRVGSLNVVRDFLDVRDAAAALFDLTTLAPEGAGIVNVCSGEGIKLSTLLNLLIEQSGKRIAVAVDPGLVAADSPQTVVGDPAKLRSLISATPTIPLERSLRDVLAEAAGQP